MPGYPLETFEENIKRSFEEAQDLCLETANCGGITKTQSGTYDLRKGPGIDWAESAITYIKPNTNSKKICIPIKGNACKLYIVKK